MNEEILWASAGELAERIRTRDLSPVEVMASTLARAEVVQAACNPFITIDGDRAMASAKAAEDAVMAGGKLGPLHGVPISVKDLCNTEGLRTTFGSLAYADNVPTADCVAVARLRTAGAVVFAKTTTPEFGHKPLTEAPLYGRTTNPWDRTRTPGGSSGGSGVAVASGVGPLAVGTDGGGSTRIPAAACGVVGIKQSLGVVPHDQTPDVFGLLAYVGPMARTVADAGLMLEAMAGPDASDPHSLGRDLRGLASAAAKLANLKGVKIGYRLRMGNERVDPETAAAFEANLATLADLGAELIERNDPFENTLPVWGPLTFSIWACRFANVEQQLGDRMTSTLRHWMAEGRGFGATEVQSAMEARTRLFRQVQSWFKEIDFLATPTLAAPALPADQDPFKAVIIDGRDAGGLRDGWYPYTHPFNLSGHPAITLPNGFTKAGLPAGGLQLAAPWFADARLFSVSAAFEAAHGIDQRRPADWT
jgi:aspartyl-tRNA(Asn)/glutamyl-tRNA(Gln) amidotransferase subunit A